MVEKATDKRYIVGNIGYAYAVFDTRARIEQEPVKEGQDLPDSSNPRNARIVEVFPTRVNAQAYANELNARSGRNARNGTQ